MLLDTHAWVWTAADVEGRLGPKTRASVAKAAAAGLVCVSTASAFEIAALATAGRLRLNQPAERWIRESVDRGGLRVLEIDLGIATDAGAIPASALPDPIDRLLVATARAYAVALITRDQRLIDYAGQTGLVRVSDATV